VVTSYITFLKIWLSHY